MLSLYLVVLSLYLVMLSLSKHDYIKSVATSPFDAAQGDTKVYGGFARGFA
jgi:hypothetical protein